MKGIGLWQFILFVVYGIRDILMLYHLLLDVVLAMEEVILVHSRWSLFSLLFFLDS